MKSLKVLGSLIATAGALAACGGGSSDSSSASPSTLPEPVNQPGPVSSPDPVTTPAPGPLSAGVWTGLMTWNDITHDHPYEWDATEIVLPNGDYYHVFNHYFHYPTETQRNTMGGFAAGRFTLQDGKFTLANAHEFSFINDFPDRPISGRETFRSSEALNWDLVYEPPVQNGQDLTRAISVNPNSDYSGSARLDELNFNNTDHRSIQGVLWTQRSARADNSYKTPMHLVISPNGSLSARFADQCQVSGRLEPRSDMKVYNATISLGANCPYAGYTFNGVAYLKDSYPTETAPDVTANRFHLIATNNDGGTPRGILFTQIVQSQMQPDEVPPAR